MKNKAFTLVELLAVIVILAIILIVAVPAINNVIDVAKKSTLDSQVKFLHRAALTKYEEDPSYAFDALNKSNLKQELGMDGTSFDAIGVELNGEKITATIVKEGLSATTSNDIAVNEAKVYGLYWDGNNTFTRTDDAVALTTTNVGIGATPATNNFDTAEIYSEMTEETDSYGNKFIKIPKFYIKKTVNGDAWTWQISKTNKDGEYYLPACFVDETRGKVLPYILVGKYNANLSTDGTKLESKTGKVPLVSKNITQFRNYAKSNGSGYQILDIHVTDILQVLFYIEFATLDSQTKMYGYATGQYNSTHTIASIGANSVTLASGKGSGYRVGQLIDIGTSLGGRQIARNLRITNVSGDTITYQTVAGETSSVIAGTIAVGQIVYNVGYLNGTTDTVIAKSGSMTSNSDGKYAMKYRGIENIYGNIWQFVDGVNIKADHQTYVSKNSTTYVSDKFDDDYTKLGYTNSNTNGYILKMGYDKNRPFAQFPISVGSGKYGDYYYQQTGNRIALLGGRWFDGANAGASDWALSSASSNTAFVIGSRLLKTPF